MKIMWILLGTALMAISVFSGLSGYSDSGQTDVDVPSCSSTELQNAGINSSYCDKAMMLDTAVPIPDYLASIISVEVDATWDVPEAWIGVVESSQSENCTTTTNDMLLCDTEDLAFVAGGPDANGELNWEVGDGDFRFVAGSSAEGGGKTAHIEYLYTVRLATIAAMICGSLGAMMVGWGIKSS